jgi:hypothetical protein
MRIGLPYQSRTNSMPSLVLTAHTVDLDYLYQPVKDRRADT